MKQFSIISLLLTIFVVFDVHAQDVSKEIEKSVKYHLGSFGINGAVVAYGNSNEIEFIKSFGTLNGSKRNSEGAIYDLASITKVFTATALMIELQNQGLSHETLVSEVLPEYDRDTVHDLKLSDLLRHQSGLRSGVGPAPYSDLQRAWNFILGIDPEHYRGEFRYSDVNYLVLGKVLEKLTGESIHSAIKRLVLTPMGMMTSGFLPMENIPYCEKLCAPTVRGAELGVVHDPTSRKLNGLAGHAGLFSTARDLSRFARTFLNKGDLEGRHVLDSSTVELMSVKVPNSARGLGFDISSPYSKKPRGEYFPEGVSYGHTGYTGTSIWIDPVSDTFLIVLSNPVYSVKWQEAKKGYLKMIEELANILGKDRS